MKIFSEYLLTVFMNPKGIASHPWNLSEDTDIRYPHKQLKCHPPLPDYHTSAEALLENISDKANFPK
jgi:hypothetical protein